MRTNLVMVLSFVAVEQRDFLACGCARLRSGPAAPERERAVGAEREHQRGEREKEHQVREEDEIGFHVQVCSFSLPRRATLSQLMRTAASSSAAASSRRASSTTMYTARKSGLKAISQGDSSSIATQKVSTAHSSTMSCSHQQTSTAWISNSSPPTTKRSCAPMCSAGSARCSAPRYHIAAQRSGERRGESRRWRRLPSACREPRV